MTRFLRPLACGGLLAGMVLMALPGCQKDQFPNPSDRIAEDTGLQSKDLIEMTDKMAADLLKIPEIAANPYKVVIVATAIDNKTHEPYLDRGIFLARLRAKLNQYGRDRVAIVEKRANTARLQQEELGDAGGGDIFEEGSRNGVPQAPRRLMPQYALKGEFYDLPNRTSNFHECTFQLTRLAGAQAGEIVWEGHYEVKTMN